MAAMDGPAWGLEGVPVFMGWVLLCSSLVLALSERRERETRFGSSSFWHWHRFESVAAASQGQSLHRSG